MLGGKGYHNDTLEGGQLVQVILTKGGLRLPKVLVVTPSWAPCRPPSCRPSGLGLVAPIWKPLPNASVLHACACPFAPKRKRGHCAGWCLPGARLVLIVMACVTSTSRGTPCLDLFASSRARLMMPPLRKPYVVRPARLGPSRGS